MIIVSNKRLTECIRYGTGGVITQKETIQKKYLKLHFFEKLFFLKKAHKVVIKIDSDDKIVLVFDIKNQCFYFTEDMIPHLQDENKLNIKYTVDKDDLVYMCRCYRTNFGGTKEKQEIRTFQYHNDKLVDAGIKWTGHMNGIRFSIQSICIV